MLYGWIIRMCYEYDAYYLYRIVRCGDDVSHQWRLEMTLADFNLRRAALFATRIFVLTQMAFPQS